MVMSKAASLYKLKYVEVHLLPRLSRSVVNISAIMYLHCDFEGAFIVSSFNSRCILVE